MKLSVITGMVLFTVSSLFGAIQEQTCQMPNAKVLRERLKGHEHFDEKTHIIEQLAE